MYGICQFLNCFVADENVFKHWLRVLTNIVYYDEIATFQVFESRIKFIDDVTKQLINNEKFDDIYNLAEAIGDGDNKTQLEQEINKIILINNNNNSKVEDYLKQLEALWLFEGNIDFIFDIITLQNGNVEFELEKCVTALRIIGEDSHKKVGDCEGLTKLFQAIIAKWNGSDDGFELLLNDEHNRLRKLLNNEFNDAFVAVMNEGVNESINSYKPDDEASLWKYGLIKGAALWKYTDKGKIVRDSSGYSLRKRIYKNEADINIEVYANFINNKANVENISYNENNTWTVKFEKSEQKEEYTNNEK